MLVIEILLFWKSRSGLFWIVNIIVTHDQVRNTVSMALAMVLTYLSWWRHQMKTSSALLTICAGNSPVTGEFPTSPVTGEFPTQRPVTRSFDVFFDLRRNKRLSKQSWGSRFGTLSRPLWRHCNYGIDLLISKYCNRADSRFAPSQCETALLCNDVSHWLGASLESTMLQR